MMQLARKRDCRTSRRVAHTRTYARTHTADARITVTSDTAENRRVLEARSHGAALGLFARALSLSVRSGKIFGTKSPASATHRPAAR
eukprot:6006197-Prymnesium_polylepis.1